MNVEKMTQRWKPWKQPMQMRSGKVTRVSHLCIFAALLEQELD